LAAEASPVLREVAYDDAELEGREYNDLANHELVPAVTLALTGGLDAFRAGLKNGTVDEEETVISVEIDKERETLLFYAGYEYDGEPFFSFKLGRLLTKCIALPGEGYATYRQELGHWFSDAARRLPKKAYSGLEVSIEVPETEGDPVFENFE
jgi:hypothetical protein